MLGEYFNDLLINDYRISVYDEYKLSLHIN